MNQVENEIIEFLENRDKIIFDIGCFRGNFTKNFIKHDTKQGHKSKFYMFDPNPNVKNYLKLLLKNEQINYFDIALDNSNSQKKFFLNNFFEPSGSSLNTMIMEDKKWVSTRRLFMRLVQPFKQIKEFSEIYVKTKTLDLFCSENEIIYIDLLKIDAEGNEKNILLGAKKLLTENKIHSIYVEIAETKARHKEKAEFIEKYLKYYNFKLINNLPINSFSFLSNLKATDNLFINKNFKKQS